LVWSATFVMVVTTRLMSLAFSRITASLEEIELVAPESWRIVPSHLVQPGAAIFGEAGGIGGDAADLLQRGLQLLAGRRDLFDRRRNLGRGGGVAVHGRLLLLTGGRDLRGRAHERDRGALQARHQGAYDQPCRPQHQSYDLNTSCARLAVSSCSGWPRPEHPRCLTALTAQVPNEKSGILQPGAPCLRLAPNDGFSLAAGMTRCQNATLWQKSDALRADPRHCEFDARDD
jgi:hypothetical protein